MKREAQWWKKSVVYQIYPRSFNDSNGDGIGDIPGVIEKLDYVKDLGCDTIWICPFYASSNYDNGYDVTDYQKILPEFGAMEDVERLISEAHKRGIRLVIDMVVNHTSCEHPWFLESKSARLAEAGQRKTDERLGKMEKREKLEREGELEETGRLTQDNQSSRYRDFYVWKKGKRISDGHGGFTDAAPNNWEAIFGGSAWSPAEKGSEDYFLHIFSPQQPDLNWESPALRQEIFRMMRWWLDKGVDGFRMDAICYISKDPSFPDSADGNIRPYVSFGPHFEDFVHELNREVLSRYENVMTVAEMSESTPERAEIFANEDGSGFSMIFQFQHLDLDGGDSFKWTHRKIPLRALKKLMGYWQESLYGRAWNSLYWSNHDQPRVFSRFGESEGPLHEKSAKMIAACSHMMQGTPYVFQGEELGMTNYPFRSIDEVRDIESLNAWKKFTADGTFTEEEMLELISLRGRDNARTPIQWDDSPNAGFTSGTPWIGVNPNYREINAREQMARPDSVFHFYRKLIALRRDCELVTSGRYAPLDEENAETYAYLRVAPESDSVEKLLVMSNFTDHDADVNFPEEFLRDNRSLDAEILLGNEPTRTEFKLLESRLTLTPYETLIVRLFRR